MQQPVQNERKNRIERSQYVKSITDVTYISNSRCSKILASSELEVQGLCGQMSKTKSSIQCHDKAESGSQYCHNHRNDNVSSFTVSGYNAIYVL